MKKNSLLSLALLAVLAVLASSASAAPSQLQAEPLVLPTYVVDAPRFQQAEQRVNASLNALRAKARTPAVISLELPALKARVALGSDGFTAGRLAKS